MSVACVARPDVLVLACPKPLAVQSVCLRCLGSQLRNRLYARLVQCAKIPHWVKTPLVLPLEKHRCIY